MSTLASHIIRLIHTGVLADGRPNIASVYVNDLDEGREPQTGQTRKVPVYVPASGFVDVPFSTRSLLSLANGAIKGFVEAGILRAIFLMRFRNVGDFGGTSGTGATLAGMTNNAERTGGVARFVFPNDEAVGFLEGERFIVSGLTGSFINLNGEYTISSIAQETDLSGPNPATYTVSASSSGPNVTAGISTGGVLVLPDFKITVFFSSAGDVGGAGSEFHGYVNGQFLPIDLSGVGSAIAVEDEGIPVESAVTTFDFVGAGVTATSSGIGRVDVEIPGGTGLPPATQVGEVLYSVNGTSFTARLPVTSEEGWLVNNDGILIVNGFDPAIGSPFLTSKVRVLVMRS